MEEPQPPTEVYRRAANGMWQHYGAVVAQGGHEPFYADGGLMLSNQLILTDSANNWGVCTDGMWVEVVDIVARDSDWASTQTSTLRILGIVKPEKACTYVDCMWA